MLLEIWDKSESEWVAFFFCKMWNRIWITFFWFKVYLCACVCVCIWCLMTDIVIFDSILLSEIMFRRLCYSHQPPPPCVCLIKFTREMWFIFFLLLINDQNWNGQTQTFKLYSITNEKKHIKKFKSPKSMNKWIWGEKKRNFWFGLIIRRTIPNHRNR